MIRRYLTRTISVALLLSMIVAGVGLVAFQASGGRLMTVQSGSMEPNVPKGSMIAVRPVKGEDIQKGDVVTYTNPQDERQTFTHRVVGTLPSIMSGGKPYLITKGDANATTDQPVPVSSVKGRLQAHAPYLGHALNFVRHPIGLLIIIYVPALTVIVAEIRRLSRYYKEQQPFLVAGHVSHQPVSGGLPAGVKGIALALMFAIGIAVPVRAALVSSVTLTGNTISSASSTPNPNPPGGGGTCTITNTGPNSTNTCTHNQTTTTNTNCSNNTSVTNTNNQSSSSGNASSNNNTNGGSATSGNASNTNSTNTTVTQTNSLSCQP